jgi:hypothetical protein
MTAELSTTLTRFYMIQASNPIAVEKARESMSPGASRAGGRKGSAMSSYSEQSAASRMHVPGWARRGGRQSTGLQSGRQSSMSMVGLSRAQNDLVERTRPACAGSVVLVCYARGSLRVKILL